ncbi:MAG TPA: pilus assembly protein N-terminal domain-containing protein, partial [Limnochordia bacterium]|nr:pilus assembly protein N-terminal domain-containing protein [Limnochordia bacterium]
MGLALLIAQPTYAHDAPELSVVVGNALLLSVDDVTRVAVADPAIADVVVATPTQVLVNGKQQGTTTLHVWDKHGLNAFQIQVYVDRSSLAKEIETRIGLPDVHVWIAEQSVILDGRVASGEERSRAEKVAGAYRDKVVDLLQVPVAPGGPDVSLRFHEVVDLPGVDVKLLNGTIYLNGVVDDAGQIERAVSVAKSLGYPVVNLLTVKPALPAGESTASAVQKAIGLDSVKVEQFRDVLLLEGKVDDPVARTRAETIARAYAKDVVDLIKVDDAQPAAKPVDLATQVAQAIGDPSVRVRVVGDT